MNLFSTKIAYAAASTSFDGFLGNVITMIINPLILLLFALAIVYFVYGVFEFIANQESEDKRTAGKQHMIWGIVGITIMIGVWTILGMVLNTLNISDVKVDGGQIKVQLQP